MKSIKRARSGSLKSMVIEDDLADDEQIFWLLLYLKQDERNKREGL